MKLFVLIPPCELKDSLPLVVCDDEEFAKIMPSICDYYTACIYSDNDLASIDALEVGEKYYDEQGWHWHRANDRNQ